MFEYKTVAQAADFEIIEKKSRFITYVKPLSAEAEAISFINEIKSKHYDASHNVYAYALRDNNTARFSDDGEPSGTAGMPTLEVIRKEGLFDICLVTTRYFGGTLLGAGGLVRAYAKSAKSGIDKAGIIRKIFCYEYTIKAEYTMLGKIQSTALEIGCIPGETDYSDSVVLKYFVPYNIEGFAERITDITFGKSVITKANEGRYADAK